MSVTSMHEAAAETSAANLVEPAAANYIWGLRFRVWGLGCKTYNIAHVLMHSSTMCVL